MKSMAHSEQNIKMMHTFKIQTRFKHHLSIKAFKFKFKSNKTKTMYYFGQFETNLSQDI